MISPRSSTHNQKAKLAADYNDLLKQLSSPKMTAVGCYSIGETIGEGTFGKVKLGVHQITGRQVAIKKISKQHAPLMAREIHHHRQLRHPNIVTLFEILSTESAIYIVFEHCPNGELFDLLTESGRFTEERAQFYFRQLVDAVKYCHDRGIVHRDLKLENILLDVEYNAKLGDFGFARHADDKQLLDTFCGSLAYSAPEVISRQRYSGPETDVWSLGVILYTLLAGELPFDDDNEIVMQRKIVNLEYQIPSYFSPEATDLVSGILRKDPKNRLSLDQIKRHPWMKMFNIDNDCESVASSARYSVYSDADSLFSARARDFDDDEYDAMTDMSSPRSSIIKSLARPVYFSAENYSVRPWNDLVERSSPFATSQRINPFHEKNRFASRPPRFSAPTVSKQPRFPQPTHVRASLPSSLPSSRTCNPDDAAMAPIEQRLYTALTAAGFDEITVQNMRSSDVGNALGTLWHMLMDNLSQNERSIGKKADSNKLPSMLVDKGIQTDAEITSSQPKTSNVQVASKTPVSSAALETQRGHSPQRSISSASVKSSSSRNSEKSGWFTSVKSWFGSGQSEARQDGGSTAKNGRNSSATTIAPPPTPPPLQPPTLAPPPAAHNKPSVNGFYKAANAYGPVRPPIVLTPPQPVANNLPAVPPMRPRTPPAPIAPSVSSKLTSTTDQPQQQQQQQQKPPQQPQQVQPVHVKPNRPTGMVTPMPAPTQPAPAIVEPKPTSPGESSPSSTPPGSIVGDEEDESVASSPASSVSGVEEDISQKLKVQPAPTPTRSWPMAFRESSARRFEFSAPRSQLTSYSIHDGGRRKPLGARVIVEEEEEEEE